MTLPLWMDNLIAYSLQIAILAAAGTLLAYLFRLCVPRVSLLYWQVLLLVCLLLPVLQKWEHPTVVQTIAVVEPMEILAPGTGMVADPNPAKIPVTKIIILILAAGALLRMLWLGLGLLRLRLYLRRSERMIEASPDTGRISSLIGVEARFFISDEIDSPATFGIFTPTVLLPGSFPEMSEACREAVVYHELLHVRRRDWALVLLEEIIRTIFWFHPAVWWLLSRIHLAREQSVDLEVVKLIGDQKPYLNSLLEIARMHGRPKAFPAPLFLRERHLVQRVALLLKEVSMNRLRLTISLAGIAFLLTGTVLMASGWFPLTGPALIVQEEPSAEEIESQQVPTTTTLLAPSPQEPPAGPSVSEEDRRRAIDRLKERLLENQQQQNLQGIPSGKQSNANLMLSYKDADLRSFIQSISKILGLTPMIIDPEVQGTATVQNSEPISKSKALDLFHRILQANNASLIEQNGIYQVISISSNLKKGADPIEHQAPEVEGVPDSVVGGMAGGVSGSGSGSGRGVNGGVSGSGRGVNGGVVRDIVTGTTEAVPNSSAASQSSPKQIGGNVLRSRLIYRVDPEYPELAQRARVQDVVILIVTVDEKGNVVKAEPVRGHPLLKDAAVDAVKQWKYEPTILNDTPVPVTATVTVNFVLSENTTTSQRPPQIISSSILKSKLIHKVNPEYPEAARKAHIQDTVLLSVTVNEAGSVSKIEALRGSPLFIASAVEAVRQWKYEPTILNGTPIPVTGTVTVDFVLKDDSPPPIDDESDSPDSTSYYLVDQVNNLSDFVIVKFDDEGEIYINDIQTALDDFESALRDKMKSKNTDTVFIRPEPTIPFSKIRDLVDRIRAMGVEKIGLFTKGDQE